MKKTTTVILELNDSLLSEVMYMSEARDWSRSKVIRYMMTCYMRKLKGGEYETNTGDNATETA